MTAGAAIDANPASDVEILSGDFDGDGFADFAKRELATGLMWVFLNNHFGAFSLGAGGEAVARTRNGPEWRIFIGDFTGDGKADYVDHHVPTGTFWVHRNRGGTGMRMDTVNWGTGTTSAASSWRTVVGDFTGDGYCDYADLYLPTGTFWIHRNYQNGTFEPSGSSWGIGYATPGSSWQILGSR